MKGIYSTTLLALWGFLFQLPLWAAFSNYSSVLIGDRAAGMGGAFTSLSGDPSAVMYYNPAGMSKMSGHSLSTAVSVYHKYDSKYGDGGEGTGEALKRVNQGAFKSIPSASGSILSFGHFAFGLSVLVPDHSFYSGQVNKSETNTSTLFTSDQSLWVGLGFGKNITDTSSFGFSIYYSSLDLQSSVSDQTSLNAGTDTRQFIEERSLTNNSLIYLVGFLHEWNENWSLGLSYRARSLEVAGKGSYYKSFLDTSTGNNQADTLFEERVKTDYIIPSRLALGVSYKTISQVFSFDLVFHGVDNFNDFEGKSYANNIRYERVANIHLGYEKQLNKTLKLRLGLYTNRSSHFMPNNENRYEAEHVDMWGFSANLGVFTSEKASFTFGGYYTGGRGYSKHLIENQFQKIKTSKQVFSMLLSSGFVF